MLTKLRMRLPPQAEPITASYRGCQLSHACQNSVDSGHHVLAGNENLLIHRTTQGDMERRSPLACIDSLRR